MLAATRKFEAGYLIPNADGWQKTLRPSDPVDKKVRFDLSSLTELVAGCKCKELPTTG